MQGFEIETTSNDSGRIEIQLSDTYKNKKVRVIVLLEDDVDDIKWLNSLTNNPAFDFLKEPAEDIYTLQDGQLQKSMSE